jgi:serine/threonine protein kinase
VLGVGAFGAVWKVRKIKTNDVYAMKVIDTKLKTNKNFFESLQKEKNVLQVIEGDFVVKAYYSFAYQECLFFVQEFLKGGDFGKILL